MRVYLDTGFFVDYFIERGHSGTALRTADRRGRATQKLCEDAQECLAKISHGHSAHTSALTLVEAETCLFDALQSSSPNVPDKYRYIVSTARAQSMQVMCAVRFNSIEVIDLTEGVLSSVLTSIELQQHAIQAADAVHMSTACVSNIDIIISTDRHIIMLNEKLSNNNGVLIRCVDTDEALTIL